MRWLIIGGILALVVTVYALVDLTVTDDRRIRRLNRVLWVVLIVVVPVIGPIAWLFWGKGPVSAARPYAPDDDPSFSRSSDVTDEEADRRIAEIEAQLAALDAEDYDGPEAERPAPDAGPEPRTPPKPEPRPKPKPGRGPKPDADDADGEGHRATGDGGDSARA
ncbi:PLDc N-terminal domain-containing protein [Agrococcus baldri]|uniref:Cardiolipin synthase N-terminal domain-containing protein n=1 Tax=Agrococcus baldri TaxID=153730 RepID=A0AA87RH51_9MICO|nr:PLDc N-terminal domain-containing protein [Agrococcus baldri]GEK79398.1 hypothetical protein ABA31_07490 [Agrococcus baldri]